MAGVPLFEITDLDVSTVDTGGRPAQPVLHGINLTVNAGEIHAVVDRDGAGASALARAVLGSIDHRVTAGRIRFRGDDITDWPTEVRARAGLFLAFADPHEIPGVSVLNLIGHAVRARSGPETDLSTLRRSLLEWMERLEIDPGFIDRSVNQGFSADEKRRTELLQLALLQPDMAVVDQTGADGDREGDVGGPSVDGHRVTLAAGLRTVRSVTPSLGTLAITHDQRLLEALQPDLVHVLVDGRIVNSGVPESALPLETHGHGNHI